MDLNTDECPVVPLLHVNQKVALQDELALFILLRAFIGLILDTKGSSRHVGLSARTKETTYIFPAKYPSTFAAVDVTDCVVTSSHLAIDGFSFDDIDAGVVRTMLGRSCGNHTAGILTHYRKDMRGRVVH